MALHRKLSLLLMALILLLGLLLTLITRYAGVQYNLEVMQRLNGSIAMYVAQEHPLIIDGQFNTEALQKLAHQAMVINPTVEVYLLDTEGRVLAHNLPPETVQLQRVDTAPLEAFLQPDSYRPLRNDDPRSPDHSKVFSTARILHDGHFEGYVYVVLGGRVYEELTADLSTNYIVRVALAAIAGVIALTLLAGLFLVNKLTRPLNGLLLRVRAFQRASGESDQRDARSGDEIQQLQRAFDRMSQRIEKQFRQIRRADETRRDLITNVSHDLRTPLASMQGYLDTLIIKQGEMAPQQTQEYLRVARKHCSRLNRLVQDLFELSKLDSNAIEANMETFSLSELMQDVALEFNHRAEKQGIQLALELLQGNTQVRADIGLMQRVLENLIENAIKHTPAEGRVVLRLEAEGSGFKVIVRDTGRGISEQAIPHIFDRLYRADNSAGESATSSGLGLAIVKKILDLHQVPIRVISQLHQGTEFSFKLNAAH